MARKKNSASQEADFEQAAAAPESQAEERACQPIPVNRKKFNSQAIIPYGCTIKHLSQAMDEFIAFLGFVNQQLHSKGIKRFESMLMPANFSSMVGEFLTASLPKYCSTLAKNQYHNGYPDLLPKGMFPGDAIQHSTAGIEVKASRYKRGWQGHNAEECWLMVFVFDSNRPADPANGIGPKPFRFLSVYLGQLTKEDWKFSGRKEGSRRTITASVTRSGLEKMMANWLYQDDVAT
jgi:hypothetical protein